MVSIQEKINRLNMSICEICKSKEFTEIHHRDKNQQNNNIWNLIRVCRKCHNRIENKQYPTRKCKYCKKEFQMKNATQKYCNNSCVRAYRYFIETATNEEWKRFNAKK